MPRPFGVVAALSGACVVALSAGTTSVAMAQDAPAPAPGGVTIVHGVRGLVADVRLDGEVVLSGFAPERVTEQLTIAAGSHRVQAWRSGAAADTPPVLDTTLEVPPGSQLTAAIGLGAAGGPILTTYDDAALLTAPGSTALAVRGLAASPPVKVLVNGQTFDDSLTPTDQQVQQIAPGTYGVSVQPAVGDTTLVPDEQIPVEAGRAVVLYLIGSQSDATLGWVAQTVRPAVAAAPQRIDTGVGPLPAGPKATTDSREVAAAGLFGLGALAAAGLAAVRRSGRRTVAVDLSRR